MPYPVSVSVEPSLTNRNRLTTAFRLILAIPHLILVGGIGFGVASRGDSRTTIGGEGGLLGAVAVFLAIVSWFTIVFAGTHIIGIRQFTSFYLRWRVRALAYFMLLEDAYPPFGDAPYPASIEVVDPPGPRDRVGGRSAASPRDSSLHRAVLRAPGVVASRRSRHGSSFCSRAAIRRACTQFGVGALRWRLRVEAYMLLMVDEYPPFSLM